MTSFREQYEKVRSQLLPHQRELVESAPPSYARNVSGTFSTAHEQAMRAPATREIIAYAPTKDAERAAFLASWDQDEREDLLLAIACGEVPPRESVSAEVFTQAVAAYRRKCLMISGGEIQQSDAYPPYPRVSASEGRTRVVAVEKTSLILSCIDPLDRLVDGLSGRACLDTWTAWMRAGDAMPVVPLSQVLTPSQQQAARDAWRHELAQLNKQTQETKRLRVVCDDQYEL
jgi:hypothetical protein